MRVRVWVEEGGIGEGEEFQCGLSCFPQND